MGRESLTQRSSMIFCVGTNHKTAGLEFREKLYIDPKTIEVTLQDFKKNEQLTDIITLSTCNRLELYGVGKPQELDQIKNLFFRWQRSANKSLYEFQNEIWNRIYVYLDKEAVNHAFKVASGLDSLVVGETQITGQFKSATALSRSLKVLGPMFQKMSQEALSVSKKVRTKTAIGQKTVSIAHTAVDLANRILGNISRHHLAIIGAGEMASIALKYAMKYQPKKLFLLNRSFEKAELLCQKYPSAIPLPLDELNQVLSQTDIIISSTAASGPIIKKEQLEKAQSLRNQTIMLIDIALPRDIDPACAELDDVYLFDIDDLKQVVGENLEERKQAAVSANTIVEAAVANYMTWMEGLNLKPTINQFSSYLKDLSNRELQRTLRGSFKNIPEEQVTVIRDLLSSICGKITADAARHLHCPPDHMHQEDMAMVISHLFRKPTHDNR